MGKGRDVSHRRVFDLTRQPSTATADAHRSTHDPSPPRISIHPTIDRHTGNSLHMNAPLLQFLARREVARQPWHAAQAVLVFRSRGLVALMGARFIIQQTGRWTTLRLWDMGRSRTYTLCDRHPPVHAGSLKGSEWRTVCMTLHTSHILHRPHSFKRPFLPPYTYPFPYIHTYLS